MAQQSGAERALRGLTPPQQRLALSVSKAGHGQGAQAGQPGKVLPLSGSMRAGRQAGRSENAGACECKR